MASIAETRLCRITARILVALIDVYRYLFSPWLGRQCRFEPSCSSYAREAILRFGALRGVGLAVYRLTRCHPWAAGGLDPVPSASTPDCRNAHNPPG